MEFSSRGFQRSTPSAPASSGGSTPNTNHPIHKKAVQKLKDSKPLTALWLIFFAAVTILVIALIFSISTKSNEAALVEKDNYQAVFLNNGQAYFGKVKTMNRDYIDLRDVYYLYNASTDAQNQSATNLSLVKLGTELHCPKDQMIIYRDQISFWENLNSKGKVATAIKEWKDQNKDGVDCSTATNQQPTQQSTSPQQTSEDTSNGSSNGNTTDTPTNSGSDSATTNNPSTSGNSNTGTGSDNSDL